MPQGMKSASGRFQRTMQNIFNWHEHRILPLYYDYVIIKGKSFREQLNNMKAILEIIRSAGFTLNVLKCSFFQTRIAYLGHIIENGSISIDPTRSESIKYFPRPSDCKSLRRFIGMSQFCHRFIPDLNIILAPLFDLLKTKSQFTWNAQCETAFTDVK